MTYTTAQRSWLSLYNIHLPAPRSDSSAEASDLAPIQRALPNEMLTIIFSKLDPYSLGKVALVCRQFRIIHEHPRLWERACQEAFHLCTPDRASLHKLMATQYRWSWKRMFVHHPHLRFDGLYASRNTYVRTGVVEFTSRNNVHLVSYYRYYRFLPDGTFLYRTSPQVVGKVAKAMAAAVPTFAASAAKNAGDAASGGGGDDAPGGGSGGVGVGGYGSKAKGKKESQQVADRSPVLSGRWVLRGAKVYCALVYPNSTSTELRSRLVLRSTHPGANNRLDIESIVTVDREDGNDSQQALVVAPPDAPDAPDPDAAKAHSRGLAPCMFVPWEAVKSCPLNLPPSQMDYLVI